MVLSAYALQAFSSSQPAELKTCLISSFEEKRWYWSPNSISECHAEESAAHSPLFPSPGLLNQLSFVSNNETLPVDRSCISEEENNNTFVCSSTECNCACFYQDNEGSYSTGKSSSIENQDYCLTEAGALHEFYYAFPKPRTSLATKDWKNSFSIASSPAQATTSSKTVVFGSVLMALGFNSVFGMVYGWSPLELAIGGSYALLRIGVSLVGGRIHPRLGAI